MGKQQHWLKTIPEYFHPLQLKIKNFEIRKNDRDFQVGDIIHLVEYDPEKEVFTGESETRVIIYMTDYAQQEGYVVLGVD